jgi:sialic acid synthase SpsE
MKIGKVDLDREVLIIAEVGNNHEGNFGLAQELVGLAAEAGVQAIKFQTFKTEHYVSPNDEARFKRLKSFELTYDQFATLAKQAREAGLMFISTPFDLQSVAFLSGVVDCMKVASGDNTFYPLLSGVADTGKPVILSTGLADMAQIRHSVDHIKNRWKTRGIDQEIAALHCVSSYPVPVPEANLRAISQIREELGITVGYSDHCLGITAALLSVGLGARVVEKHFTINKNYSSFRDHQLSADPQELKELALRIREANEMLGSGIKKPQPSEIQAAASMRRSIVSVRPLESGHILKIDDLTWVRPAGGLAPGRESLLIGKKLVRDVSAGHRFEAGDVH